MRKISLFAKKKKKKKKKCERSSAQIFQLGDVKWSAAAKGMVCSAMNVKKITSALVTLSGVVALNGYVVSSTRGDT